jgi:hypothetical protein
VRDNRQALGRVLHERDLVAVRVHQSRRFLPEFLKVVVPGGVEVGERLGLRRVRPQRVGGDLRQRAYAGVVEEDALRQDRELGRVADQIRNGARRRHLTGDCIGRVTGAGV